MGRKLIPGINDLESQYPEIAKQWDLEKNEGVKPSEVFAHSNLSYWWKCEKGHSYPMVVGNKTGTRPQGCPICANKIIVPGINDISTTHPDISKHWDFEKNGDLTPIDFGAGSNKYVFWKCDKGHSFDARIYNMMHTRRKTFYCPICENAQIQVGYNDLTTTHPKLVEEWDYEKNTVLPTQVTAGMQKKIVWWKCKKHGHSFPSSIELRAKRGLGCPYCANQKLLKGFNDTATLCPQILDYWDYENNENGPDEYIGIYSNKTVSLKCSLGHRFETTIGSFTRGDRCPYCGNKRVLAGFNDLKTTNSSLSEQWDYDKNIDLTPEMVTQGSDKKVWWKCQMGHSWPASINSRVRGNGCPICSKQYQTSIAEKAVCFFLSKYFEDLEENIHLPSLGKRELDIYIPSIKLGIEFDGQNFHKNQKRDYQKDVLCEKNGITLVRIREEGCPVYESSSIKITSPQYHGAIKLLQEPINKVIDLINQKYKKGIPLIVDIENYISDINERFYSYNKSNSLESKAPNLVKEWNYKKNGDLKPSMISVGCNSKVWWICDNGHEWQAVVAARVRGNGCPYCSGKTVLKGINDLETLNPNLAKQWNYKKNGDLTPQMVTTGSDKKVWWICDKGHEWPAPIANRFKGVGCPYCSGLLPIKGQTDLETLYPNVAKQWDYEKNGDLKPSDIVPGSEKMIWWICDKGHSYPAVARTRTYLKTGCPVCQNKRVIKGVNDLETLVPELAKEWNYNKNGSLLPSQVGGGGGSHKKVWWICNKGHEWPATLSSRIRLHTGCPQCYLESKKKG